MIGLELGFQRDLGFISPALKCLGLYTNYTYTYNKVSKSYVGNRDEKILPGSLAKILTILSFYDMNLTRIQSLPIPGKKWQYFFYADITFSDYNRYTQALAAIRPLMDGIDIMGEYISGTEL